MDTYEKFLSLTLFHENRKGLGRTPISNEIISNRFVFVKVMILECCRKIAFSRWGSVCFVYSFRNDSKISLNSKCSETWSFSCSIREYQKNEKITDFIRFCDYCGRMRKEMAIKIYTCRMQTKVWTHWNLFGIQMWEVIFNIMIIYSEFQLSKPFYKCGSFQHDCNSSFIPLLVLVFWYRIVKFRKKQGYKCTLKWG